MNGPGSEIIRVRGRAIVVLSEIRGSTVVELDCLSIRPLSGGQGEKGLRLYIIELNWPDLIDFENIVYFLGIQDGMGRNYHVFRIIDQTGSRIRLETGRDL